MQRFSGELLRSLRESVEDPETGRPLSREALGRRIGRSYFAIRRWELGEFLPDPDLLARLAWELDCGVSDFFEDVPVAAGGDAA